MLTGLETLIVAAVLGQIARLITDYGKDGVKLLCCCCCCSLCKDKLEMMKETLLHLDDQLKDVENKSLVINRMSLHDWLSKTKTLLYDIEDIVGEYCFSKEQYDESSCRDKCSMFCSMSNPLLLKVLTACKMELKRDKLKWKKELGRQHDANSDSAVDFEKKKQKTATLSGEEIIGRDGDLEKIMATLRQETIEKIPIVPIVGPLGSGKSSLARLIFRDAKKENKFEHYIWVFVPMGSINLEEIGKDIVKQTKRETGGSEQNINNDVRGVLMEDRCLIVIDNLWDEDEQVDKLRKMLEIDSPTRSKVIVTTHSEKVAELMSTVPPCKLSALSDDDCSIIFCRAAGIENDAQLFREYGDDIVRRCGRIPLVAEFLGSVVKAHPSNFEVWEAARDNDMWNLEKQFFRNKIRISPVFPSLEQIYYNMPPALKLCFVYCSIFPKGSAIHKESLVQQWIAHHMVDPEGEDEDDKLLHVFAENYIQKLKAMSFLQASNRNMMPEQIQGSLWSAEENIHASTAELIAQHQGRTAEISSNPKELLYMHSLAYDLARSVANDDIFVYDEKKPKTTCRDHRYARLSASDLQPTDCKKLRSLIVNTRTLDMEPLRQVISLNKYLRVLDLSGCGIKELPSPICQLNQLRYLNASTLPIIALPESFGDLCFLRFLNLLSCSSLQSLPESFGKLKSLKHLDISQCTGLKKLPTSFDNLKMCHIKSNGCDPNLISEVQNSSQQAVEDPTGGANSSSIAENVSSSQTEADIPEPICIPEASASSEASSSTPLPPTLSLNISVSKPPLSNGETKGEAELSRTSFQSAASEFHEEANPEGPDQRMIGDLTGGERISVPVK